jgi:hypothetical protein
LRITRAYLKETEEELLLLSRGGGRRKVEEWDMNPSILFFFFYFLLNRASLGWLYTIISFWSLQLVVVRFPLILGILRNINE